jgi:hypothetical protein
MSKSKILLLYAIESLEAEEVKQQEETEMFDTKEMK